MKKFHNKLSNIYEDLELKQSVTEETGRPDFAMQDWILAGVYDHILEVLKYDPNHEDIVSDLFGQFRQLKDTIERRYEGVNTPKLSGDTRQEEDTDVQEDDGYERFRKKPELGGEGTFIIDLDRDQLIVSIDDVEETISGIKAKDFDTGEMVAPSAGFVRSRLQSLLAKMGYDVGTPGTEGQKGSPGTYNVNIIWASENPGQDIDKFQLVPRDLARYN